MSKLLNLAEARNENSHWGLEQELETREEQISVSKVGVDLKVGGGVKDGQVT